MSMLGSSAKSTVRAFCAWLCVAVLSSMVVIAHPDNLLGAGLPSGARALFSRPVPAPRHLPRVGNPVRKRGKPAVEVRPDETLWNGNTPFEISFIDGLYGSYSAGEPIEFHVEGRSPVQIEALPENGFALAATLTDSTRSNDIQSAAVTYDESARLWKVSLTAPKDTGKSYEIMLQLYCRKGESLCAEVYGADAQTSTIMPLDVY